MNFQLIHIHKIGNNFATAVRRLESKKIEYVALAIEEGGHYFYWARGVSIQITQQEYWYIKTNPKLYYFSTALKLHERIERAIKAGAIYAW